MEQHLTNEFYLNELREHSRRLFGIKPEVIDGALFNIKGNQITKSQVERYIRLFLTREAN
ncbi:hypothetical protein AZF04_15395 [Alkalihalobacillus trypoxylicola]|uniref:YqzN/YkzM domain-containing protein n=1 Tax=Alkalihalobacillus trypoxylicola TaxID=519424 RepID=A0A162EXL5_9BACI|nr:hypothetical protein AZF04_15395 [Alkalihalobacillus trypoxylicola]